jgi:hypothetical protein
VIVSRLGLLRQLPLRTVARRAAGLVGRKARAALERRRDFARPTYAEDAPSGELGRLVLALPPRDLLEANRDWIIEAAEHYRRNCFDVLGSGWLEIRHGLDAAGIEGQRYPTEAPRLVNDANRTASAGIRGLIGPGFTPIDWQRDIKSGFRWHEDTWRGDIAFGHRPGVDVKVPWELARFQHAPTLVWAYALTQDDRYRQAFRDQVLDFIAANPPRFGVNWVIAMEAAIRAANWVLALDLFRAAGAAFDEPFLAALKGSLVDHGRFVVAHLEWYPEGRANHYFADVAGLAFIAAALPCSPETDAWLAFAAQEIVAETAHQFLADGGSFEASTCYHRLTGEMAVFATALLLGMPEEKRRGGRQADAAMLLTRPTRKLCGRTEIGAEQLQRISRIGAFTAGISKPDGRVPQIGDNDSGRFFKLHPVFARSSTAEAKRRYANLDGYRGLPDEVPFLDEDALDHRAFIAAADALLGRAGDERWIDAHVVRALATRSPSPLAGEGGARATAREGEGAAGAWGKQPPHPPIAARWAPPSPARGEGASVIEIEIPGADLRDSLERRGFPEFGLYVWRSARLYLAVRCGAFGRDGRGAHAHNDQLAFELAVDGEDWVADPGSYLYTASREWRNAYRSVRAHATPSLGDREPGRLDLADFFLPDTAQARCLAFEEWRFVGEHQGFGTTVRRTIEIAANAIVIRDVGNGVSGTTRFSRASLPPCSVPFSPGYGKRLR